MKTITSSEFKANVSSLLKQTRKGESFRVIDDETGIVIGYFTKENSNANKVKSGLLEGKAKAVF